MLEYYEVYEPVYIKCNTYLWGEMWVSLLLYAKKIPRSNHDKLLIVTASLEWGVEKIGDKTFNFLYSLNFTLNMSFIIFLKSWRI